MENTADSDEDFVIPDDYRHITTEEELAYQGRAIARFLDSDTDSLPPWKASLSFEGLDTWTQPNIDRLVGLNMTKTLHSPYPNLNLYSFGHPERLDPAFPAMLNEFTHGDSHIFLTNASGTGKTRLVAETLVQHWGLYFTCSTGSPGSDDLAMLLQSIGPPPANCPGFVEYIPLTTNSRLSRAATALLAGNRTTTRLALDRLLLSRLLVLKEFRSLCEQRGISDQQARRKWIILQLQPHEVVGGDPFCTILSSLKELSPVELRQRLTAILAEYGTQLKYVVVDDAHVSLRELTRAFVARNGAAQTYRHAPIMHELAACFAESLPGSRLVVSSSQDDMRLVADALLHSGATNKHIRRFDALRALDSVEACTAYVRHFFADEVSDEDCRLAYKWMRGRFRFIALLVAFTLMFGARNFKRSLHAMLFAYGNYESPEAESLLTHFDFRHDTHLVVDFEALDESSSRMVLRRAAMMYAFNKHAPDLDKYTGATVSLGAGLYRLLQDDRRTVTVSEPLVLLRLAHWVRTSTEGGIHAVIRQKLEDSTFNIQEACFCYGFPAVLWDALTSDPSALEDWLDFPGLRLDWTRHSASIVLPRFRQRRRPFLPLHDRPASLLQIAASSSDVFEWLHNAETPFLIPDDDFGADLLFMLNLYGGTQVLVVVHTQFSEMKRTRRDLRVVPTRPDELYKNAPENNQKLMGILAKLPPLPIGSRKRARGSDTTKKRYAQLPLLRLLCFAQPWRVDEAYDPPVASVNFRHLLQLPPPEEIKLADIARKALDSV